MFRYLITGTGRCGTGYVAMVLRSADITCGHESVFGLGALKHAEDNIQSWEADSSWLAAPYLQEPFLEEVLIVHLVRHPKDVIDSLMSMRFWTHPPYAGYVNFALQHLPDLASFKDPEEKSAYFYFEWNRMIEPYAVVTHCVEDPIERLLESLGIDYIGKELFDDTTYNTRRTWPSDVDISKFGEDLLRYGYS